MAAIAPALYLIPCALGDVPIKNVLPAQNKDIILGIKHFIVEEIRSARRFLKTVDKTINIDELTFYDMGKHADKERFASYLTPLRNGNPIGVISEAGCPAIADPGADIVFLAQKEGLRVTPLVGPSSILLCVMASGFNGQSFAFHGYLPIDGGERVRKIKRLESISANEKQTQLFIETPYRNGKLLDDLCKACKPTTWICIAVGITTEEEQILTKQARAWKKCGFPAHKKIPAIFALYAG